jgi:hypothetical protein
VLFKLLLLLLLLLLQLQQLLLYGMDHTRRV